MAQLQQEQDERAAEAAELEADVADGAGDGLDPTLRAEHSVEAVMTERGLLEEEGDLDALGDDGAEEEG